MCEQTEIDYLDGEVVWVKLGSCWWPGEVVDKDKLPPDVLPFRKPPIACVKFFQEDAYEYVKNINNIYKYNCSRKSEFISKGLYLFRTKHGHMEKFPDDVIRAETAVNGDVDILTREEFQETKKESYAGLFGNPKKTPAAIKKGKNGKGRYPAESPNISTPRRQMKEKTDYKVHILLQGHKPPPSVDTSISEVIPTTSTSDSDITAPADELQEEDTTKNEDKQPNKETNNAVNEETSKPSIPAPSTPLRSAAPISIPSSSGIYSCHACPFSTTRLNVLILHNKTHSVSFMPYTPSPIRKKTVVKSPTKSTPNSSKAPKPRKPRKEKTDKTPTNLQVKKRASGEKSDYVEVKKRKTDEEIKSSLLADWDDDVDDDSNDESSTMVSAQSPEVPIGAESPAVPTPAELPSAQIPAEMSPVPDKKSNSSPSTEKPESSSDSKYEFCEDEDWPEEADIGRKIPRVKNPIRTEDTKSVGIDEDEVAREVAELLNKTAVPELPSVPEPLRIEENFPEPSIVKSPDKSQDKSPENPFEKGITEAPPTKAIFKTKTFFRSRHSRSQDAIGKYVAEQLNAVERMDISESEINGSEAVSSPEARDSPPIEPVKVARLAPKIQLKKMKAEAAQLREKEKTLEPLTFSQLASTPIPDAIKEFLVSEETDKTDETKVIPQLKPVQDVLYPTREIKPLNEDTYHNFDREKVKEPLVDKEKVKEPFVDREKVKEPFVDREKVEEPFTDKDLFMGEETSKIIKEDLNNEEKTIQISKFENEIPIIEEETSKLEDELSKIEEESPNYKEETPKYEEEAPTYEEESTKCEVELPNVEKESAQYVEKEKVIENTNKFDIETTRNEEEFKTSEIETELPVYAAAVQTSFNNETSKLEEDTPIFQETPKHDVKSPVKNNKESAHKSSENNQDFILNRESELVTLPEHITKLPASLLLEKEERSKKALKKSVKVEKSPDQMALYMNESTASAVDALLSVSRETDRVPRVVTNDLPEDLFEDDKDTEGVEPITNVNAELDEKMDTQNSSLPENGLVEHMETEEVQDHVSTTEIHLPGNNFVETTAPVILNNEEIVDTPVDVSKPLNKEENNVESVVENVPSESDLQVAEALINLPATAIRSKTPSEHTDSSIIPFIFDHENSQEKIVPVPENVLINDTEIGFLENEIVTETVEHPETALEDDNLSARFETEQEKSENLNAAQSLVQMSESIEHKMNVAETMDTKDVTDPKIFCAKQNNNIDTSINSINQNMTLLSNDTNSERPKPKMSILDQSSSKLLKILEEPCKPKLLISKTTPTKPIVQGKEKILNFDVAKSVFKSKTPKQKIIIRRNPTPNKTVLNKVTDLSSPDKIILSRSGNQTQEGSSVQTFTIQTSPDAPSDANTIIIQQKIRKVSKPPLIQPKLQKIKPQMSLVAPVSEVKTINKPQTNDDTMFDINSMPIVLSEDLLTPESIEKMPVVMSDANIISQPQSATKVIKPKQNVIEHEKVVISSAPHKPEVKTLLLNQGGEVTKSVTPNILSKSAKLRGAKPMLVIDKATGKQKIIMTKSESVVKELKQSQPTIIQPAAQVPKTEKFIILPTQSSAPRPTRTQKIVIDPQTGKAHMFVAKCPDGPLNTNENKQPMAAKLLPSNSEGGGPGNTVMIITNAQGAQSRIVLTPRHERILFPNKQQPNVSQLKTISHRITSSPAQKTMVTSIAPAKPPTIAPVKTPTRIVPKQNKSAIITSKGQLIVGGRVATTAQNIAPMPELRPVGPKRIVTSEPKKITQTVQKTNSEPIIFLQQKSGAVMQLTAAQFEHLQRTGQIVQKSAPVTEKLILQKTKPVTEPGPSIKRTKKFATASPTPLKKMKHEVAIAPAPPALAPAPAPPAPALVPTVNVQPAAFVPAASNVVSVPSGSAAPAYAEFDNFEEMLPSTAIARQQVEPVAAEPAPPAPPAPEPAAAPPAGITDQLLAVPGEHFGALAGTFYLCVEENGGYTPIDNRPLVLENNQLVPMEQPQPERRDILEAALANSDVFHADAAAAAAEGAPDFRDLNANVSVHCRVSETSTTLHQPIMTPVEVPSAGGERAVPASLEDGLAVIGVTPHTVPTSLELPITVTDPRIAPPARAPRPAHPALPADMFDGAPPAGISMPLLTDEEGIGGKSMPILTEDGGAGAGGSPGEPEEGGWARRLRTPGSDTSEASLEIPLQPALQLSAGDLERS